MKTFFLNLLQTLVAAAIIGTFAMLWKLNERVSRIENRLGIVALSANQNE